MKKRILVLLVLVNSIAFAASPAAGKKTITTTTTTRTETVGDGAPSSSTGIPEDHSRFAGGFELLGSAFL